MHASNMSYQDKAPQAHKNQPPFLMFDNVSMSYPNGYLALRNINITINQGEFVCLIGHSGCGKSTLLSMVSGFSKPSQGKVLLKSEPISKPGPDRMVVFQNYALLPWRTVYENVYLAVNTVYKDKSNVEKNAIVRDHLALVGLTEAAEKKRKFLGG
jgi:bicarbonate transport system ATP-binding protein